MKLASVYGYDWICMVANIYNIIDKAVEGLIGFGMVKETKLNVFRHKNTHVQKGVGGSLSMHNIYRNWSLHVKVLQCTPTVIIRRFHLTVDAFYTKLSLISCSPLSCSAPWASDRSWDLLHDEEVQVQANDPDPGEAVQVRVHHCGHLSRRCHPQRAGRQMASVWLPHLFPLQGYDAHGPNTHRHGFNVSRMNYVKSVSYKHDIFV